MVKVNPHNAETSKWIEGLYMNESVCGIIPDKEWLNTELQFAYQKIISNLDAFTDNVPSPASKNLQYIPEENTDWTASFWVGMLYHSQL